MPRSDSRHTQPSTGNVFFYSRHHLFIIWYLLKYKFFWMEESVLLVNKNMVWLRCLRGDTVDINPSKYGLNIAYFFFMLFCLLLVLSSHRCVLTANLRNIYLSFAVFFHSFLLSSPFCHSCCCCSATNFSFHSKCHATNSTDPVIIIVLWICSKWWRQANTHKHRRKQLFFFLSPLQLA